MKLILLTLLAFTLGQFCHAQEAALLPSSLRTLDGKEYKGVTLRSVTPDAVQIIHDDGTASIAFVNLPEELRAKFRYDPAKAAEFARTRARQAEVNNAREQMRAAAAEREKKGEQIQTARAELEKVIMKSKIMVKLEIIQVLPNGVLGGAHTHGVGFTTIPGTIFLACSTTGLVDGSELEGPIYPCGTYSYTNTSGARATVSRYASTVEKASTLLIQDTKKKAEK